MAREPVILATSSEYYYLELELRLLFNNSTIH